MKREDVTPIKEKYHVIMAVLSAVSLDILVISLWLSNDILLWISFITLMTVYIIWMLYIIHKYGTIKESLPS